MSKSPQTPKSSDIRIHFLKNLSSYHQTKVIDAEKSGDKELFESLTLAKKQIDSMIAQYEQESDQGVNDQGANEGVKGDENENSLNLNFGEEQEKGQEKGGSGMTIKFKTRAELVQFAKTMENAYNALGIPNKTVEEGNTFVCYLPAACNGKDPFSMNEEELAELRKEIEQERIAALQKKKDGLSTSPLFDVQEALKFPNDFPKLSKVDEAGKVTHGDPKWCEEQFAAKEQLRKSAGPEDSEKESEKDRMVQPGEVEATIERMKKFYQENGVPCQIKDMGGGNFMIGAKVPADRPDLRDVFKGAKHIDEVNAELDELEKNKAQAQEKPTGLFPSLTGGVKDALKSLMGGSKDDSFVNEMSSGSKGKEASLMSKDDFEIGNSSFDLERQAIVQEIQDVFKRNDISSTERESGGKSVVTPELEMNQTLETSMSSDDFSMVRDLTKQLNGLNGNAPEADKEEKQDKPVEDDHYWENLENERRRKAEDQKDKCGSDQSRVA